MFPTPSIWCTLWRRTTSSWPPVLSRAVRLAHSVRKQMVFAYPDEGVRYLEIKRLKP